MTMIIAILLQDIHLMMKMYNDLPIESCRSNSFLLFKDNLNETILHLLNNFNALFINFVIPFILTDRY